MSTGLSSFNSSACSFSATISSLFLFMELQNESTQIVLPHLRTGAHNLFGANPQTAPKKRLRSNPRSRLLVHDVVQTRPFLKHLVVLLCLFLVRLVNGVMWTQFSIPCSSVSKTSPIRRTGNHEPPFKRVVCTGPIRPRATGSVSRRCPSLCSGRIALDSSHAAGSGALIAGRPSRGERRYFLNGSSYSLTLSLSSAISWASWS